MTGNCSWDNKRPAFIPLLTFLEFRCTRFPLQQDFFVIVNLIITTIYFFYLKTNLGWVASQLIKSEPFFALTTKKLWFNKGSSVLVHSTSYHTLRVHFAIESHRDCIGQCNVHTKTSLSVLLYCMCWRTPHIGAHLRLYNGAPHELGISRVLSSSWNSSLN